MRTIACSENISNFSEQKWQEYIMNSYVLNNAKWTGTNNNVKQRGTNDNAINPLFNFIQMDQNLLWIKTYI